MQRSLYIQSGFGVKDRRQIIKGMLGGELGRKGWLWRPAVGIKKFTIPESQTIVKKVRMYKASQKTTFLFFQFSFEMGRQTPSWIKNIVRTPAENDRPWLDPGAPKSRFGTFHRSPNNVEQTTETFCTCWWTWRTSRLGFEGVCRSVVKD